MEKLFIPILLGTARVGRKSEVVAKRTVELAANFDFTTELIDVSDFGIVRTEEKEKAEKWKEIMSRADGLIIVAPEYNHGYPGELKLLLDLAYTEYNKKPLGIVSVSKGGIGGARMAEQLKLVSIELQMIPLRTTAYIFNVESAVTDGSVNENFKPFESRIEGLFKEMIWYADVMKRARHEAAIPQSSTSKDH